MAINKRTSGPAYTNAHPPTDTDVFLDRPQLYVTVAADCPDCAGTGTNKFCHPYCAHPEHDEVGLVSSPGNWTVTRFNALMRSWSGRLPCGHQNSWLKWTPLQCETCGGSGYIQRWVSVWKFQRRTGI